MIQNIVVDDGYERSIVTNKYGEEFIVCSSDFDDIPSETIVVRRDDVEDDYTSDIWVKSNYYSEVPANHSEIVRLTMNGEIG